MKTKRKIKLDSDQISILLRYEKANADGEFAELQNIKKYLNMSPFIRKGKYIDIQMMSIRVLDKQNNKLNELIKALPVEYEKASQNVKSIMDDYGFYISNLLIYKHFWAYTYIRIFRNFRFMIAFLYEVICIIESGLNIVNKRLADTVKEVNEIQDKPQRKFSFDDDIEYLVRG
ncbi:hypothetical protein QBE53_06195 [Vallitaleaceae bacterium 9-2]